MINKSLFGTSGIRGDGEKLFTEQFSFDMGRVFALFLKEKQLIGKIAVAGDSRSSTPRIKKAFASGMIYEGREVFDEGVAPVPSMNILLQSEPSFAGAAMISGSHIKKELNGIKFFALGGEILKEHERKINDIYKNEKIKVKYIDKSEAIYPDEQATDDYKQYLLNSAKSPYPFWKIIVDPGNGAQSDVMPWVIRQLGLETVEINSSIQNEIICRDTEVQDDFKILQEEVLKQKADMGIGYDSDGDRVIFVDEKGKCISGDYTGSLIARELPGEWIVTPISTSKVVELIGKKVARTKVGSPYVVAKMKELNAVFGFEANGGGIFPEVPTRDGGRVTIEMLNLLSQKTGSLSALVSTLPRYFQAKDKIEYKWEEKSKIELAVRKDFKGIKIDETDGIKIWLNEDSWILFRSSQNAPEFRVFAEAKSEKDANELLLKGLCFVKDIIN